ncbi:MAG TPA: hypothetical protein VHE33_16440, partial [Acidobacteriaceae bacterium]|nr:hypothetical protein [Acidobacteriaceae bacterium]
MGEEKANIAPIPTLFPILGQTPVGIARLAAHGEPAGDGHLVQFRTIPTRSILNRVDSKRVQWMSWS